MTGGFASTRPGQQDAIDGDITTDPDTLGDDSKASGEAAGDKLGAAGSTSPGDNEPSD